MLGNDSISYLDINLKYFWFLFVQTILIPYSTFISIMKTI